MTARVDGQPATALLPLADLINHSHQPNAKITGALSCRGAWAQAGAGGGVDSGVGAPRRPCTACNRCSRAGLARCCRRQGRHQQPARAAGDPEGGGARGGRRRASRASRERPAAGRPPRSAARFARRVTPPVLHPRFPLISVQEIVHDYKNPNLYRPDTSLFSYGFTPPTDTPLLCAVDLPEGFTGATDDALYEGAPAGGLVGCCCCCLALLAGLVGHAASRLLTSARPPCPRPATCRPRPGLRHPGRARPAGGAAGARTLQRGRGRGAAGQRSAHRCVRFLQRAREGLQARWARTRTLSKCRPSPLPCRLARSNDHSNEGPV